MASEIVKAQLSDGRRKELYHFRDQQGLEVDFVVPGRRGKVVLVEAKGTRTGRPELAKGLATLGSAAEAKRASSFLVHRSSAAGLATTALRPGVRAVSLPQLLAGLA